MSHLKQHVKLGHTAVLKPVANGGPRQSYESAKQTLMIAIGNDLLMTKLRAFLPFWHASGQKSDHDIIDLIAQQVSQGVATLISAAKLAIHEAAVKTLIAAQDAAMKNPAFRPSDDGETTHCSEGTLAIAQAVGSPVVSSLGDGKTFYQANKQIENLESDNSGYRESTAKEAQELADEGELTFVTQIRSPHGHIASLRPEKVKGDVAWGNSGPLIANIGVVNHVLRVSKGLTPKHGAIVYYVPK
jgi:hypothetical protein